MPHGVAHPQQVGQPVRGGDLVEALPALGAVLRLVPGAKGQRGKADVGAGQVLGRAQRVHARVGAPGTFAAARRTIDDAHVAHALAHQGEGGRLPAHAAADDQHVEHRPAVGARRSAAPSWGPGNSMRSKSRRASAARAARPAAPAAGFKSVGIVRSRSLAADWALDRRPTQTPVIGQAILSRRRQDMRRVCAAEYMRPRTWPPCRLGRTPGATPASAPAIRARPAPPGARVRTSHAEASPPADPRRLAADAGHRPHVHRVGDLRRARHDRQISGHGHRSAGGAGDLDALPGPVPGHGDGAGADRGAGPDAHAQARGAARCARCCFWARPPSTSWRCATCASTRPRPSASSRRWWWRCSPGRSWASGSAGGARSRSASASPASSSRFGRASPPCTPRCCSRSAACSATRCSAW